MNDNKNTDSDLQVRGISLLSTRTYMKAHLNKSQWQEFLGQVSPPARDIILTIKKGDWYPFSIQRILREEIAARFNPQNPRAAVFEAYLESTRYEISTFLRGIFSFLPVHLVIGRAAALWGKYYIPGKMEAIVSGDNSAALQLSEFPADKLFCPTVQAWLTVAAGFLKLKDVKVEETECIHRGDQRCRWEVHWE